MPATLKEVANFTGLSIPTVSEILNNKKRLYKDETRVRVLDAARQLGYRPNLSARSMKSGRFGTIAMIESDLDRRNFLPRTLLESIEEAVRLHNLLLLLGRVSDQQLVEKNSLPHLLRTWAADGLLINYVVGYPARMMELLSLHHIPAVWINSKHAEDCVYPNDEAAANRATLHLIELGHERIAFVNYNYGEHEIVPVHYSSLDRYRGYCSAMEQNRLTPIWIRSEDGMVPMSDRVNFSLNWLRQPGRPTAIIAYTPETANAVIYAARILGINVPEDLSVITFDEKISDSLGMNVDTMVLPEEKMGQFAVEKLLAKIETPTSNFAPLVLDLDFASGWTSCPPRAAAKSAVPARLAPKRKRQASRKGIA